MERENAIANVTQVTHNSHLNYYAIDAVDCRGKHFPYYMASRAENLSGLRMNAPEKAPDGVAIFSLYGDHSDQVVLVRQFRYPVGDYVYEFPAGLVEEGESFREGAVREMKEETGLTFCPIHVNPMYEKPFFMTDGLTDECCSMVYGTSTGSLSISGLEDSEKLQPLIADKAEVRRILKEERVAMSAAFMLMHFLSDEDPFAFLGKTDH